MSNKEMLYKLEEIIDYLKKNGGYNHKLYNHCCPNFGYPDSNIVEYAEDIKEELFNTNNYQLLIINEICTVIKDNLKLLLLDDNKLLKLKEYCKNNVLESTHIITHDNIIDLTNEALLDLLSSPYLYDFRELE